MTNPEGLGSIVPPSLPPLVGESAHREKTRRRTRRWAGIALLLLALGAAATGYAMWLGGTQTQYEAAVEHLDEVRAEVVSVNEARDGLVTDAEAQQRTADTIETLETASLFDQVLATAFASSVSTLDEALVAAPRALAEPREADALPDFPWDRARAAEQIEARADAARNALHDLQTEIEAVATASTAVDSAAAAFFGSAAPASEAVLAANISAENEPKVALQRTAANVSQLTQLTGSSAAIVITYVDAATALAASQQEELDEKAGPLLMSRLDVEQFARELAPGLMVDFDWAPIVAGSGAGLSVGGTAHWWMDPGYATITLSDSVAELWGTQYDDMVRALVAHEVGHALTIRCGELYDSSTQENIEEWATAWAIVQGYTGEGNGVSVYGEPSQSMLDAARGCS